MHRDVNNKANKNIKKKKRKLEPLSARIIKEIGCYTDPVA
jgi:hypothetical protein